MKEQFLRNKTPEFISDVHSTPIRGGRIVEPPVLDLRGSSRVVSRVKETDVEGMHHPIVRSKIGHLPPILIQAVKRCVACIPVQEVIPFPGRPYDDRGRIDRVSELPHGRNRSTSTVLDSQHAVTEPS